MVNLAKERMENSETYNVPNNGTELSDKMNTLVKNQQKREIKSLYPENETTLPSEIEFTSKKVDNENKSDNADNKPIKSMGQALEHDVCIDNTRMIDPEISTGGLYEFVPATQIKGMEDWIPESEHYRYYQTTADFPLEIEPETEFLFPEHLSLYTYEMGNCSEFRSPHKCLTGKQFYFQSNIKEIADSKLLPFSHSVQFLF